MTDFTHVSRYDADMFQFSRKPIQVVLLCYTAFLVYATLWPFDFNFAQGLEVPDKISWIPFFDPLGGPNRKDALMNILVFLPFGVISFLSNSASSKIRRPVLVATLLGGALSFTVETVQIGLPSRHPSISDLLMNATGALLGALSARAFQRNVDSDPERFRLLIRENAVPLAMIAYTLALLASTMRTFDPILNRRVLGIRARAFIGSPLLTDHFDRDYTAWMVLSFGFLSFLATECIGSFSMDRRRLQRYGDALVICSLYAVSLEALQILFRSRHPLPGHAILGFIGVAYGISWHAILIWKHPGPMFPEPFRAVAGTPSKVFSLFLSHYCLLLFLAFLSPIHFSPAGFHFDVRGLIPFYFYLQDISLPMIYLACKPVILHLPLGAMTQREFADPSLSSLRNAVLLSVCFQAIIEFAQGFLVSHSPDPWNILLAALGASAGSELSKFIRPHG